VTAAGNQAEPSPENLHSMTSSNSKHQTAKEGKRDQPNGSDHKKSPKRKNPDPVPYDLSLRSSTLPGRKVKSRLIKLRRMSEISDEEEFSVTNLSTTNKAATSTNRATTATNTAVKLATTTVAPTNMAHIHFILI
jgi:hypothetical protein